MNPAEPALDEDGQPKRELPHPWRLWVALAMFVVFLIVMWQFIAGLEHPDDANGTAALLQQLGAILHA